MLKKLMRAWCDVVGHMPDGKVHGVFTNVIPELFDAPEGGHELHGGVRKCGYRMRLCKRCGKRIPISPADAEAKARITAGVAQVMNGARAGYGLRPLSWED